MAVMITEETKLIWSVKSVLSLSLERLHVCPKGRQRGKPEILTLHCKNTGVFFFYDYPGSQSRSLRWRELAKSNGLVLFGFRTSLTS